MEFRRVLFRSLYRAPQDLINAVSRSLPLILLSSMFGPIPAGLYALAAQVVGAPSVLVGSAVSTAVYPSMVERMRRKEDITSTLKRGTTILALIGLPPFAIRSEEHTSELQSLMRL